ncbi:MAG: histidine kinase [Ginsengibacter sp.]
MVKPTANNFIFSSKYRLVRHFTYWFFYLLVWACYWTVANDATFIHNAFKMLLWLPAFMAFTYPLVYLVVPRLLLKSKYFQFILFVLCWGVAGWYFNAFYRAYIFLPAQSLAGFPLMYKIIYDPNSFLCMTTTAGCLTISSFTKRWVLNQRELAAVMQEKTTAQLQLLKAQLHPHFLFNTLNNIYSFALENSHKTPQMILKLSSLLSYMLYDCKGDEVMLEKELEVMKNYIDLEKERYGEKIDISVNIEGDIRDKYITPLLILPFLENAFKHGTSQQLDRPWMSVDIIGKGNSLMFKVSNSKNEYIPFRENGVGINNVKKRLELLYPGKYDLKINDEGEFFVVSLLIDLSAIQTAPVVPLKVIHSLKKVSV